MEHDTELAKRAYEIAVRITKSENMRVSAAEVAVKALEYLRTEQGAADAKAEGVPPTTAGLFDLVKSMPKYPSDRFGSFRSFERLLQIGRAPDPVAADQAERDRQATRRRSAPSSNPPPGGGRDDNPGQWGVAAETRVEAAATSSDIEEPVQTAVEPAANIGQLAAAQAAVAALSTIDFAKF